MSSPRSINPVRRTISPDSPIYATFALNAGLLLAGGLIYLYNWTPSMFSIDSLSASAISEKQRADANVRGPNRTT
jgi:hypothetical protein